MRATTFYHTSKLNNYEEKLISEKELIYRMAYEGTVQNSKYNEHLIQTLSVQ